jgi:hypothetical protein
MTNLKLEYKPLPRPSHIIKRGNYYMLDEKPYILAQTSAYEQSQNMCMCLINLSDGNRFTHMVEVKDIYNVSKNEWKDITSGYTFELITDLKICW